MCSVCGCDGGGKGVRIEGEGHHHHHHGDGHHHHHHHHHHHDHPHDHDHSHGHDHGEGHHHHHHDGHDHTHARWPADRADAAASPSDQGLAARLVTVERDLFSKNDAIAGLNRQVLLDKRVLALNLVSSPGSGKTSLLCETLRQLDPTVPRAVIEGDQETANDADRIRETGTPALQINTGKGCHLDAEMMARAFHQLPLPEGGVLFVENVGNLVCPAGFDLGEAHKVAVLSVTEGEDKPLKYPDIVAASDLILVNKCDLLPYLEFDVDLLEANARRVNPAIEVLRISARTGHGMAAWLDWIAARMPTAVASQAAE